MFRSHLQESPKRLGSQSELDQFVGSHEVSVVGFVKGNGEQNTALLALITFYRQGALRENC